jgi:chemotaxis protein histidine kinase CheA
MTTLIKRASAEARAFNKTTANTTAEAAAPEQAAQAAPVETAAAAAPQVEAQADAPAAKPAAKAAVKRARKVAAKPAAKAEVKADAKAEAKVEAKAEAKAEAAPAAKAEAKPAAKPAVKRAAKAAAKPAVKPAAKPAAKRAVKATAKPVAKAATEEVVKEAATQPARAKRVNAKPAKAARAAQAEVAPKVEKMTKRPRRAAAADDLDNAPVIEAPRKPRFAPVTFSEEGGVRYLHFGTEWVQGAMRLSKPQHIELEYAQQMMSWLLFLATPERIVQLGLGAAALTKFAHRYLRPAKVEAIELNPAVVVAARTMFDLPHDDARLTVRELDAWDFVQDRANHGTVGALQIDIYDATARGPVLDSVAFYRAVRELDRARQARASARKQARSAREPVGQGAARCKQGNRQGRPDFRNLSSRSDAF